MQPQNSAQSSGFTFGGAFSIPSIFSTQSAASTPSTAPIFGGASAGGKTFGGGVPWGTGFGAAAKPAIPEETGGFKPASGLTGSQSEFSMIQCITPMLSAIFKHWFAKPHALV